MAGKEMIVIDQIKFKHIDVTDGEGFEFITMDVVITAKIIHGNTLIPYSIHMEIEEYEKLSFNNLKEECEQRFTSTIKSEG